MKMKTSCCQNDADPAHLRMLVLTFRELSLGVHLKKPNLFRIWTTASFFIVPFRKDSFYAAAVIFNC